jgi:hypothetical protein
MSFAQDISKDLYLKRSVRQDNQTYQFKVMENTADNGIVYNQKKFYYWFKSQAVVCTQGASSGLLLHGLFESFYDNNQLSSRGVFHKGVKHGVWTYWNLNGIIIRTELWDYGVKRGDEKRYDDKGKWMETIDYGFRSDERTTRDSIIVTNKEGIRQKVQLLDSIGNVKQTIKYKNGFPVESRKLKVESGEEAKGTRHKAKEEDSNEAKGKRHKAKEEDSNEAKGKRQKAKEEDSNEAKGKSQKAQEERSKKSDVRKQSESNFWKRLFSKKKKENSSQQAPKKFSWKFWKKDNSPKK